jgi:hypothetical protein
MLEEESDVRVFVKNVDINGEDMHGAVENVKKICVKYVLEKKYRERI